MAECTPTPYVNKNSPYTDQSAVLSKLTSPYTDGTSPFVKKTSPYANMEICPFYLLLETGDFLLQENGSKILLDV